MPKPQSRGRPPFVAGDDIARGAQRRVRVDDPVGQPLEQLGFVGLHAQVMELDLGMCPGQRGRPFERRRRAVLVGEFEDVLTRVGDDRGEDRVNRVAGLDLHSGPKAEDRIQHRTYRVRQRAAVDDRDGRTERSAPPEESSAISLVLDEVDRLLLHRDDMGGPHRLFVRGPWTAGCQQGADVWNELGLHEQVLKRWVSGVRRLR